MRKYLAILAAVGVVGGVTSGLALADSGGAPNANACFGQTVKSIAPVGEAASTIASTGPGAVAATVHALQGCKP